MTMTPEAETHTPLLICQMAQQRYALRLPHVVEVSAMVTVTTLPDSHPALLGMANRRGAPLPIYDLRRVFGFARAAIDVNTLFIVVQADDLRAGLVVDDVFQVQYVQTDAVQATQSGGSGLVTSSARAKTYIKCWMSPPFCKHSSPPTDH